MKEVTTFIELPITPPITLPINTALSEASVIAYFIPIQPCSRLNKALVPSIPNDSPMIFPI